jgi:hypothetical protein
MLPDNSQSQQLWSMMIAFYLPVLMTVSGRVFSQRKLMLTNLLGKWAASNYP